MGFWDADLATPLLAMDEFRRRFQDGPQLEIVMGSRVQLLGTRIERSARRHYLSRVAATAVSMVLGVPVYDTQCGAKLFRATPLVRRLFAEPFFTRWLFDVEILARWLSETAHDPADIGHYIVEVPLQKWSNVGGSKLRPMDFVQAPYDLWRIHRRYGRFLRARTGPS